MHFLRVLGSPDNSHTDLYRSVTPAVHLGIATDALLDGERLGKVKESRINLPHYKVGAYLGHGRTDKQLFLETFIESFMNEALLGGFAVNGLSLIGDPYAFETFRKEIFEVDDFQPP